METPYGVLTIPKKDVECINSEGGTSELVAKRKTETDEASRPLVSLDIVAKTVLTVVTRGDSL